MVTAQVSILIPKSLPAFVFLVVAFHLEGDGISKDIEHFSNYLLGICTSFEICLLGLLAHLLMHDLLYCLILAVFKNISWILIPHLTYKLAKIAFPLFRLSLCSDYDFLGWEKLLIFM